MKTTGVNIIVAQDGAPSQTASGIYINVFGENRSNRPNSGIILEIGPDVKDMKVGDRVLFSGYAGVYFRTLDDQERIIITESEIMLIITDPNADINSHFDYNQMYKAIGAGA